MPEEREKYDEGPEWRPPYYPLKVKDETERSWAIKLLEYIIKRFRPLRKHWYNSGVATITTATAAGTYEDVMNFITDLGYPATAGVIQNRGPGNLFFVTSLQPDDVSPNEVRLDPGETFRWGGPDNPHQIYYMHIRADTDDTDYQVIGGSGKLELTGGGGKTSADDTFTTISSDKDTHFTGALAQFAKEDENLTGLPISKIAIKTVRLQADQNLDFAVIFWSKDSFDDTDLDADSFRGFVRINLAGGQGLDMIRPGAANQYYGEKSGLNILYEDEDDSKEIHASLMNLSPAAKNSGATGEVKLDVDFEERTE